MNTYYITILLSGFTAWIATINQNERTNNIIKNEEAMNKNTFFVFITACILIIVAGLRWKVGTDYLQYSRNYVWYADNVYNNIINYSEPGIGIISKISRVIYDDYSTMFFISSVITVGLFVRTISKYSNMFVFSIMLYIFTGIWSASFNGVRQYLACSIIFAGHYFIIERKLWKYILVVLLASLFHISALSVMVLYFVPLKRLKLKKILLIMISSILILYLYDYIFAFIDNYKGVSLSTVQYSLREVSFLRILVAFAPLLLYYTLTPKNNLSNDDTFYINLLFINAATALATSNSAYLARFLIYTNVYSIIGIPRILKFKDKELRWFIKGIILILYSVFWYVEITKNQSLSNFQWIFNRN